MKEQKQMPRNHFLLGHKAPHSFYFPEPKYENTFDDVENPTRPPHFPSMINQPGSSSAQYLAWNLWSTGLAKNFPDRSAEAMLDFERMVRQVGGRFYRWMIPWGESMTICKAWGSWTIPFIFTSDNGLLEGSMAWWTSEPGMSHPAYSTGRPLPQPDDEGRVIDAQTLTLDFASSILEICNAEPLPSTQGKSWKKL